MKNFINIAIVVVLCFFIFDIVKTARERSRWLETPGKVVETSTGWGLPDKNGRNTDYPFYVKYAYEIKGTNYSKEFKFSGLSLSQIDSQKNKMFPGATISVFYNPKSPADSYIKKQF